MALSAIVILALSVVLYILLRSAMPILADAYLFLLFIFAFVVSDKSFSMFYLIIFLVAIVVDLAVSKIDATKRNTTTKLFSLNAKGFKQTLLFVIVGVIMFGIISVIGSAVGGNIVGVPNLAVSSTKDLALAFKPTFESMLGVIENRVAIVMFLLLNAFGLFIPLLGFLFKLLTVGLPLILVGLIMGFYHVAAYGVSISLLLWASFAFMMFIASYFIFKDSLSADIAHIINNGSVSLSRSLSIAI